ncbi:glycosyltransferase [Actinomycetaceae bacterium MB13-C1-2]|nr:glycosyltransferase [Actinomycetaceae bacterium MB13-C1-2]
MPKSIGARLEANRKMVKVVIASRIFDPEPAAASFRLRAVAHALIERGDEVTVLTSCFEGAAARSSLTHPSTPLSRGEKDSDGTVLRWPVMRDKTGYLRGYVPYMSFDLPLFFRLLTCKRSDVVLVEPPPTTGFFVRLACAIRRVPYVWYAADVWSDATKIAGTSAPVVSVVRALESFTLSGAAGVIAVSEGVAERARSLGAKNVCVIPNGIDTSVYTPDAVPLSEGELREMGITGPYLLYAGTASEWQGAEVFAEAAEYLMKNDPQVQIVFVGQGSRWDVIGETARQLHKSAKRDVVVQLPQVSPEQVARLLGGAELALVSIVPGKGYDFAYPTKVLAALSSGTPVLYAGVGPVADEIEANGLGFVSSHEPQKVAQTLTSALEAPLAKRDESWRLHRWVKDNRSLEAAGSSVAEFVEGVADKDASDPGGDPVITVVSPWYPTPDRPVSGLFVQREVVALHRAGLDVRVVHLDRDLEAGTSRLSRCDGVQLLRIGMDPANPVSVAKAQAHLRAALKGSDIVHSHAISALPVVSMSRGRIPWIHTEHWSALSSPDSASLLLQAVRPAFASLLRLPDVVVAESERLAEPIRRFRGSRPVEIIPCIVPAPRTLAPYRDAEPTMRLMSTGGVIDRKNPLLAVRTLFELSRRGIDASLRWIGDGDQREEAVALARELGVEAYFPGSGSPSDVEEALAAADIFFGPTKGENFFVAAAEALVNGRPICASDQGGHVEYADPRFCEIVVDQTPEAYAEALIRLRDKTSSVSAEQISNSVAARFSPESVATMYSDIYERIRTKA